MIQPLGVILTYFLFYFVPFGVLGYLIAGLDGVYCSSAISLFITLYGLLFGDSWLLALSHSIPLKKNNSLWEKSLNLISVKDLRNLSLYECRKYPYIVCCLTSAFGKNSLVLGTELLKNFSDREKDLLMELSTNYLKTKPTFLRTQFSLALSMLTSVTTLNSDHGLYKKMPRVLRKITSPLIRIFNSLIILLKYILFPVSEIKRYFIRYSKPHDQIEFSENNKADLIAIVEKLRILSSKSRNINELVWFAYNDLALIPMGNDSSFMFNHYKPELEI